MFDHNQIIDLLLTDSLAFVVNNTIGMLLNNRKLCRYSWE